MTTIAVAKVWEPVLKTRQAKYPNEIFVRFVARNFYAVPDRSRVEFLDIGCGAGANTQYLLEEGFSVTALDATDVALNWLENRLSFKKIYAGHRLTKAHSDAQTWIYPENSFDCIMDINTLCHVEHPPYFAIHDALKKDGKFFCIAPAHDTWKGVGEGKGFTRFRTCVELGHDLRMFSNVNIDWASYPDRGNRINSWIVEASR
jgi:2-polyprenyl-3-methyl-5-hydroxy-6-metoxy-1,4-benzoquinol methylase